MSELWRRCALATAALAAVLLPLAAPAQPAEFPNRTVRLTASPSPGGATDALARQIAEKLSQQWKQPVVVENKPGANTMLGTLNSASSS